MVTADARGGAKKLGACEEGRDAGAIDPPYPDR